MIVTPSGTMFLARRLNSRTKTLEEVTVEEFDEAQSPTVRVDARSAVWEDGRWVFYSGSSRRFSVSGEEVTTFERLESDYTEPVPSELDVRKLSPEEMNLLMKACSLRCLARKPSGVTQT